MADDDTAQGKGLKNESLSNVEDHPDQSYPVVLAAADVDKDEPLNTLRPALMAVACWRLDDQRFEFDSSFVLPGAASDFEQLAELHADYADSPLSLFGHADPVGKEDYNKKLSGNRARAVFGLLTRDLDLWEKLHGEHDWGLKSAQLILIELEDRDLAGNDESGPTAGEKFAGQPDGKDAKEWKKAVERFQVNNGLKKDGIVGADTRKKLYELYMDALASKKDGTPFTLKPEDFLGEGKDKTLKGAVQGCSEFNPVLLLSDKQNKLIDDGPEPHATRNGRNAPNRRVVMYFFPPGLKIDPKKWPCPAATAGTADCRKRFWSDSKVRLTPDANITRTYGPIPRNPDDDRDDDGEFANEIQATQDTFACRFYDRFARRSPCEAGFDEWVVQLLLPGTKTSIEKRARLAHIRFVATTSAGITSGVTDANGTLRIRSRDPDDTVQLRLEIPHNQSDQGMVADDPDVKAHTQNEPPPDDDAKDSSSGSAPDSSKEPPPPPHATVTLTLTGNQLLELIDGDPAERAQAIDNRLLNLGFGALPSAATPRDPTVGLNAYKQLENVDDADPDVFDANLHRVYGS